MAGGIHKRWKVQQAGYRNNNCPYNFGPKRSQTTGNRAKPVADAGRLNCRMSMNEDELHRVGMGAQAGDVFVMGMNQRQREH